MKSALEVVLRRLGAFLPEDIPAGTRIFSSPEHQIFFGYYDVSPFSADGNFLLAMRAPPGNNSPHDTGALLELGYYDLREKSPTFNKFAATACWNWQQGCRLRWIGNRVLFNGIEDSRFVALLVDPFTGETLRIYDRPVYALSRDGRKALSLNFSRLHKFRRGYGYHNLADLHADEPTPAQDGVWLIDMEDSESRLVLSLRAIAAFQPQESMHGAGHYLNHLDFNPSGTRIQFFHLWQGTDGKRRGRFMTASPQGQDLRCADPGLRPSHYAWLDDEKVLLTGTIQGKPGMYHIYNDRTGALETIFPQTLTEDGHPVFAGDGMIVSDTYPGLFGFQHLFRFSLREGGKHELARLYAPPKFTGEMRCDLHPRLDLSCKKICIDVVRDGRRAMAVIDRGGGA